MVYRHPLSSIQHPLEDPGICSRVDILKVLKLSKMPKTEFAVHHGVMLASHLETQKIGSEIRHWSSPPQKNIQKQHIGVFFVHVTPKLSEKLYGIFSWVFPSRKRPLRREKKSFQKELWWPLCLRLARCWRRGDSASFSNERCEPKGNQWL